ncbi:VanW family protein [Bacillus sp. NEB1478]|uniref:VanW family protein n=1 Tax=Bacillus sp. NEB1478 TaxID=3073816 RepID=UPI002872B2EB|nr:VanW family protein [Bacillus sp. NEB1478]WNB92729.1 VanW family protein [Bacillus sp. NEB1478]
MAKREFNPKSFLIIFVSISLTALFLFVFSSLLTNLYFNLFEEHVINKGVKVGTIAVGNLTSDEAVAEVNKKVSDWQKNSQVVLKYNEQTVTVDPEAWTFRAEDSIQNTAKSTNLLVDLNKDAVDKSIAQLKADGLDQLLDKEMLYARLKKLGADLQTLNLELNVNEFLTTYGQPEEVVSESSIALPGEHVLLEDWIEGLDDYEVKPGQTFSLIQAIQESGMTAQDSIDINVLSSAIYAAVQKTNFTIVERHTSRKLPDYVKLGYEANVKPEDMDFVFQNPNAPAYKLKFLVNGNTLVTSIVGAPFPYTYKIKLETQVFKPKTIIHFNENLSSFLSSVLVDSGSDGYLTTVNRESYKGTEKVETMKFAEDFYPPEHRLEERGFPTEEAPETDPSAGTPTEGTPSDGNPSATYPDGTVIPTYPYYPYPVYPNYLPGVTTKPVIPGIPGTDKQAGSQTVNQGGSTGTKVSGGDTK